MFQEICKKLICPVLTVPYFGVCRKTILKTNGLAIEANYKLEPLWTEWTTPTDDVSFYNTSKVGKAIHQKIVKSIGLRDEKCRMLYSVVSVTDEGEPISTSKKPLQRAAYYIVTSAYLTDNTCQDHLIVNKMAGIVSNSMPVKIKDDGIMYFKVGLIDQASFDDINEPLFNYNTHFVSSVVSVNSLMACPTIKFTRGEYSAIHRKIIDTRQTDAIMSVFDEKNEFDKGNESETSVCFSDYMAVVVNNASVQSQEIVFGFILYFICHFFKAVLL